MQVTEVDVFSIFKFCHKDKWETWKAVVYCRTLVPTDDQCDVVAKMHERLLMEKAEDSKGTQRKSKKEPLRSMIQGLPGAEKTMVITLLVKYFETILGWTHGKEFQCIASMNTMAALIGGATIHSFGEGPIGEDMANTKKKKN